MSSSYRTSVTGALESTTDEAGNVVTSRRMTTMSSNKVTPETVPTTQIDVVNYSAWLTSTAGEFPSSLKLQGLPKGYFISALRSLNISMSKGLN